MLSDSKFSTFVTQEAEDSFSFPILSQTICDTMVAEIDQYRKHTGDSGIALQISQIGFDNAVKQLVDAIHPLLVSLYPKLQHIPYIVFPKLVSKF